MKVVLQLVLLTVIKNIQMHALFKPPTQRVSKVHERHKKMLKHTNYGYLDRMLMI